MDTCQYTPPPAIIEIAPVSKYGNDGKERDTIDPMAQAAYEEEIAPINTFKKQVVTFANKGDADCLLRFLYEWSKGNALNDIGNETGVYVLSTFLSSTGAAYKKLGLGFYDDPRQYKIRAWFKDRARFIRDFYSLNADKYPRSSKNNHRYWAGYASSVVGINTNDLGLRTWGFKSFTVGVCSANPDGSLPLEMARGDKGNEYQIYATNALVAIAESIRRYGYAVDEVCNRAYANVVNYSGGAAIGQPWYRLGFVPLYPYDFQNKQILLTYAPFNVTDLGGRLP